MPLNLYNASQCSAVPDLSRRHRFRSLTADLEMSLAIAELTASAKFTLCHVWTLASPSSGADNVQLAMGTTSTTLAYWRFHVDWTNTANTTFTGPSTLTVASYTPACGTTGT